MAKSLIHMYRKFSKTALWITRVFAHYLPIGMSKMAPKFSIHGSSINTYAYVSCVEVREMREMEISTQAGVRARFGRESYRTRPRRHSRHTNQHNSTHTEPQS